MSFLWLGAGYLTQNANVGAYDLRIEFYASTCNYLIYNTLKHLFSARLL
ncbi:protein of unknown function [Chryseobacterium sp. JV274]|nr:protein of unknown function [Chryseobacterium sp. JV274]